MIFVDSSFFIALANSRDRWHGRAEELARSLPDGKMVTELVIAESVTSIGALGGGKAGMEVHEAITQNCEVVFVDKRLLTDSMEVYLRYDGTLSVADAASVTIMRERGVKEIVSFDADFDKVTEISRIH